MRRSKRTPVGIEGVGQSTTRYHFEGTMTPKRVENVLLSGPSIPEHVEPKTKKAERLRKRKEYYHKCTAKKWGPATEAQVEKLKELGAHIPHKLTKEEANRGLNALKENNWKVEGLHPDGMYGRPM